MRTDPGCFYLLTIWGPTRGDFTTVLVKTTILLVTSESEAGCFQDQHRKDFMITVLLQIDNSVYQYWPDHMISVSYWLTLLPWNFVYLENQYDNCKRSLITKNKLDSQKSSSHGIVNYSFVSMGENSTVRLWGIFIFHFYIVLQLLVEGGGGRYHKIISDFGKSRIILYEECEIHTNYDKFSVSIIFITKQCQLHILNGIMMTACDIYMKNQNFEPKVDVYILHYS